jgi:hypothetical protein
MSRQRSAEAFALRRSGEQRVKQSTVTAEIAETAEKTLGFLSDLGVLCG